MHQFLCEKDTPSVCDICVQTGPLWSVVSGVTVCWYLCMCSYDRRFWKKSLRAVSVRHMYPTKQGGGVQGALKSLMQCRSAESTFFYEDQALSWINTQVKYSSETKSTVNIMREDDALYNSGDLSEI